MSTSVIIAGARTPIGKLSGALASLTATDLGGHAIAAAIQRSGLDVDGIDAVVMGTVVQAGVGPNPARQAAVAAGLPMTVPATTVNNLCLSGLEAIMQADRLIATGAADVVVAGGMESMTNAPYVVRGARQGLKYGSTGFEDTLDRDALTCAFDGISMGASTERYQASEDISRTEQDEFAACSHRPPPRRPSREHSPPRSRRSRSPRARVRSPSPPTRASGPRPRSNPSANSARPSPRRARSPRARPRSCPTARPRSW